MTAVADSAARPEQDLRDTSFTGMHLRVGETMIAQPLSGFEAEPFAVSFIGAHRNISFLVSLPLTGNQGRWVTPGNQYKFRVVHGKHVYAFTARSLRAHSRPYPYAHFSIPEIVKYRQVRDAYRLEIHLPVDILTAAGARTPVSMRDLSEHGARLETNERVGEVGCELKLEIPLPDRDEPLAVSASICNRDDPDLAAAAGRYRYGVSFTFAAPRDEERLRHFIDHTLVEQLA